MPRRLFSAPPLLGAIGVLIVACNPTPDIPNDLPPSRLYSGRGDAAAKGPDPDPAPQNGGEQALTGGQAPSPIDADAGTPPKDGGPTSSTSACSSATSRTKCLDCCDDQAPGAVDQLNTFWNLCACADTRCGAYCAKSWCAGLFPAIGDSCDVCLNAYAGTCNTKAEADCNADPACAKLFACDQSSGCATKP